MLTGYLMFFGLPNVGKSTLLNCFAKSNFALTNFKPQTTRKADNFLYEDDDYQVVCIDTPGIHWDNKSFTKFMNKEISKNFSFANCVCYLSDLTRDNTSNEEAALQQLKKKAKNNFFILFTKKDLVTACDLDSIVQKKLKTINKYFSKVEYLCISSYETNVEKIILNKIQSFLKKDEELNFIPISQEQRDKNNILDIIRGVILNVLQKEVPHGVYFAFEECRFNSEKKFYYLEIIIFVEKESHKGIVIGANGKMIKKIGIKAREKMLQIYDCDICLKLKVKTKKDWRNQSDFQKIYHLL